MTPKVTIPDIVISTFSPPTWFTTLPAVARACTEAPHNESHNPVNDLEHGTWRVFLLVLHVLGLSLSMGSNGSIVAVIVRTQRLHTPSCVPMLALALSDMLLALVWHCTALARLSEQPKEMSTDGTQGLLESSPALCGLVGALWQTLLGTSTLFQGVVACDRYLFIVHPLRYEVFVTTRKVTIVVLLLPLLSVVLPVATLLSGDAYTYLPPAITCISRVTWYVLFLALVFLPSFAVILASNAGIWALCLRQMKGPQCARLVRQMSPLVCEYNLEERHGRVKVRRDTTNEISCCCLTGFLHHSGPALNPESSPCLRRLVENSALLFVEGLFAAVPSSSPGAIEAAALEAAAAAAVTSVGSSSTADHPLTQKPTCPALFVQANPFPNSPASLLRAKAAAGVSDSVSESSNTEPSPGLLTVHPSLQRTSSAPPIVTQPPSAPSSPVPGATTTSAAVDHSIEIRRRQFLRARTRSILSETRSLGRTSSRSYIEPQSLGQASPKPGTKGIKGRSGRANSQLLLDSHSLGLANPRSNIETRSLGRASPTPNPLHFRGSQATGEDNYKLLYPTTVLPIGCSSSSLHVEAFDMLELPVQRAGVKGNPERAGFTTINCPSPISVRSFNLSSSSSGTPRKLTSRQDSPILDPTDPAMVLTAVVNPIVGWMMHASPIARAKRRDSVITITRTSSAGSCLLSGLGVGLSMGMATGLGKTTGTDVEAPSCLNEEKEVEEVGVEVQQVPCGALTDGGNLGGEEEEEEEVQHEVSIQRRAKAALLVTLPVVSLACTVLPFVIVQMFWAGGWSISPYATAVVAHLMYVLLPSLNPFLMGMTNRHFRHALAATFRRRQE